MPIIKAFSEGKEIQKFIKNYTVGSDRWIDVNSIDTSDKRGYRIKPEPTYRPFKNTEECWQEMLKHQPFGWIRCKDTSISGKFMLINSLRNDEASITSGIDFTYSELLECYTFVDGVPFGVKVEE